MTERGEGNASLLTGVCGCVAQGQVGPSLGNIARLQSWVKRRHPEVARELEVVLPLDDFRTFRFLPWGNWTQAAGGCAPCDQPHDGAACLTQLHHSNGLTDLRAIPTSIQLACEEPTARSLPRSNRLGQRKRLLTRNPILLYRFTESPRAILASAPLRTSDAGAAWRSEHSELF
jgi:hypothetical protein